MTPKVYFNDFNGDTEMKRTDDALQKIDVLSLRSVDDVLDALCEHFGLEDK